MSTITIAPDERYQVLPSMPPEQFEALKADIAERGVQVPIDITEDGFILDGHHRYRACIELGISDFPTIVRPGLAEEDRRLFARNNNMLRRHLNRKQIRDLIRAQLKDTPNWANSRIAQGLGVDTKTVQAERSRLEATLEIPKFDRLVGADGKERSARRPAAIMAPNAEELARILDRIRSGNDPGEGFMSAQGFVVLGRARDPLEGLSTAERREWVIAMLNGMHPDHVAWARRREFRSPSEYFGPAGQRWFRSVGLRTRPNAEARWKAKLRDYDGRSFEDLEAELSARYEAAP